MNFSYVGNGVIVIEGCTQVVFTKRYTFKYAVGSKVYICGKAKRGVIESIIVKKVLIRENKFAERVILYIDTLNGMWNEFDLCTHADALSLASDYLNELLGDAAEAYRIICRRGGCAPRPLPKPDEPCCGVKGL